MKKLVRITIELDTEHPVEAINKAIKAGVADTAWLNKDCVRIGTEIVTAKSES